MSCQSKYHQTTSCLLTLCVCVCGGGGGFICQPSWNRSVLKGLQHVAYTDQQSPQVGGQQTSDPCLIHVSNQQLIKHDDSPVNTQKYQSPKHSFCFSSESLHYSLINQQKHCKTPLCHYIKESEETNPGSAPTQPSTTFHGNRFHRFCVILLNIKQTRTCSSVRPTTFFMFHSEDLLATFDVCLL